jgi:hypothetical protein
VLTILRWGTTTFEAAVDEKYGREFRYTLSGTRQGNTFSGQLCDKASKRKLSDMRCTLHGDTIEGTFATIDGGRGTVSYKRQR